MSKLGSADNRLKVAIVGAGPSGFYAADALINSELKVEVNLLEKLCAPYLSLIHISEPTRPY